MKEAKFVGKSKNNAMIMITGKVVILRNILLEITHNIGGKPQNQSAHGIQCNTIVREIPMKRRGKKQSTGFEFRLDSF